MKLNKSYFSIKDGKILEKGIQREICDWLSNSGYFFWRSNNTPIFGRSNDGQRRFRALPKYTPKGLPDVIILDRGNFVAVEIKREGQKLKPDQKMFSELCANNGGYYIMTSSLEEFKKILLNYDK